MKKNRIFVWGALVAGLGLVAGFVLWLLWPPPPTAAPLAVLARESSGIVKDIDDKVRAAKELGQLGPAASNALPVIKEYVKTDSIGYPEVRRELIRSIAAISRPALNDLSVSDDRFRDETRFLLTLIGDAETANEPQREYLAITVAESLSKLTRPYKTIREWDDDDLTREDIKTFLKGEPKYQQLTGILLLQYRVPPKEIISYGTAKIDPLVSLLLSINTEYKYSFDDRSYEPFDFLCRVLSRHYADDLLVVLGNKSENPVLRERALKVLKVVGDAKGEVLEKAEEILHDTGENLELRETAAYAIGSLGTHSRMRILVERALDDKEPTELRESALRALRYSSLGDQSFTESLAPLLDDPTLRLTVARTIVVICPIDHPPLIDVQNKAVNLLVDGLTDKELSLLPERVIDDLLPIAFLVAPRTKALLDAQDGFSRAFPDSSKAMIELAIRADRDAAAQWFSEALQSEESAVRQVALDGLRACGDGVIVIDRRAEAVKSYFQRSPKWSLNSLSEMESLAKLVQETRMTDYLLRELRSSAEWRRERAAALLAILASATPDQHAILERLTNSDSESLRIAAGKALVRTGAAPERIGAFLRRWHHRQPDNHKDIQAIKAIIEPQEWSFFEEAIQD